MSLEVGQVAEIIVYVSEVGGDAGPVETLVGPPGPGVPNGGLIDEVLVKLSGTNQDTAWTADLNMNTVSFKEEYDNAGSGSSKVINFANGQKQKITITEDTVLTILNPPGVGHYQLRLIQDATGGRAVSFTGLSGTRWLGSVNQPDLHMVSNGESILSIYFDGSQMIQSLAKIGAR